MRPQTADGITTSRTPLSADSVAGLKVDKIPKRFRLYTRTGTRPKTIGTLNRDLEKKKILLDSSQPPPLQSQQQCHHQQTPESTTPSLSVAGTGVNPGTNDQNLQQLIVTARPSTAPS